MSSQFKLTLLSSRWRREVKHEKLLWSSWACTKWSLTKDASPLMCREETSVPAHVWVTSLALALALASYVFPLCPPRGWTEESHHLQTDSSLTICVAAKQNISGCQRERWSPSNIIFWHLIDRWMERTHTFTYKDNNHQLQFYFKSQIVFLCDSSKLSRTKFCPLLAEHHFCSCQHMLYFIEIMHDVTKISEMTSRAIRPHRLG